MMGLMFGFGVGTGHLTYAYPGPVAPWRTTLATMMRTTLPYQIITLQKRPWAPILDLWRGTESSHYNQENLMGDPGHPRVFQVLREAIVREENGFVHPDLGMLIPAPSGAARGLGMVRDSYNKCQQNCNPGIASEKLGHENNNNKKDRNSTVYRQEEVLLRVPLSFQMTRKVALETLNPILGHNIKQQVPLENLDDAALLVLLLAHERGHGRSSRWVAYIASLPVQGSCGYSSKMKPYMLDAIAALGEELGVDVNGWPGELSRAEKYADWIATGLNHDYGNSIRTPAGVSQYENLQWALCQVASRATAGSDKHGALRMVPMMDMINHDVSAGGFVELTGKERLDAGDFVDAEESDSGTFVVRSLRHGRRKPLRKGQELLVNYNVPSYSPLDWFISLGFVPPERWNHWEKVDAALPRVNREGPLFAGENSAGT